MPTKRTRKATKPKKHTGQGGDRGGRRPALYGQPMKEIKLSLPEAWIEALTAGGAKIAPAIRARLEQTPEIAALR